MNIFPEESWTTTEVNVLAAQLDHPTVKKYFRMEARRMILDLTMSKPDKAESDAEYLRRAAEVRGQIAVFEALSSIEAVKADNNGS